jgi:hypothetical protein
MRNFTEPQKTAITRPCIQAEQTAQQIYRSIIGLWSIVLTCNVGDE